MGDLIDEADLLPWPDAPRGRELNASDLTDYVGLLGELEEGIREVPQEECPGGVLVAGEIAWKGLVRSTLRCFTCGGVLSPEKVEQEGYVAGRSCPNYVDRKARLGGPYTIWPGEVEVSRFARWNMACPKARGRVVMVGPFGPKDGPAYARAQSITEVDPLELAKCPPDMWRKICKEKRKAGAIDLVVVYLPPPNGRVAMLKGLIHGRGAIRSIVYPGPIAGMRCRELEVEPEGDETQGWTFYEYSRK